MTLRQMIRKEIVNVLGGEFNFQNQTQGKFRVCKNGTVSYYAYGEMRYTDIDSLLNIE